MVDMAANVAIKGVDLAANVALKGVKLTTNVAGKGALSLATFLLAAIKDQKRTKGKTRIKAFQGKPTKVFVMRREDFEEFATEAKKYGVLYAAVVDKKRQDGLVDVVVNAGDAARVNRIAERFTLTAKEVEQAHREREHEQKDSQEEPQSHTVDDTLLEEMLGENPTEARGSQSNLSAPLSKNSKDTDREFSERPSVREKIAEIEKERKAQQNSKGQTLHKQPKEKEKARGK